jgi:predicted metalloprotease with PDZ domain
MGSAVISDLEDDKVIVQGTYADAAMIQAEANEGCAMHGKQAIPISSRCMDKYCTRRNYLFACQYRTTAPSSNGTAYYNGSTDPSAPWFGLRVEDRDQMGSAKVVITRIDKDGPAEKAGLRTGDIVESFDGASVSSAAALANMTRAVSLGDRVPVDIRRNGSTRSFRISASRKGATL